MVQNKVKDTRRPGMPGWIGPGYTPKAARRPANPPKQAALPPHHSPIRLELQQLLLNIFRDTYAPLLISDELSPTLQEIKAALFERDFARAFGAQKYLEVYAARWSPSRALCYASVLIELREHLDKFDMFARGTKRKAGDQDGGDKDSESSTAPATRIVCLGGGAAEVVGIGGALRYLLNGSRPSPTDSSALPAETESIPDPTTEEETATPLLCDLHLVDTADWAPTATTLTTALISPPVLSPHASARARAAAKPLMPATTLRTTFHQLDAIALTPTQLADLASSEPCIITLFFTLNELFTASTARTTAMLLSLSTVAPRSVIIVIDSPGSYSEAAVGVEGAEKRKYPMAWLLDHALLSQNIVGEEGGEGKAQWEKLLGEEAKWFRLSEKLKYPIQLEDMRFQVHVYKRL
ncbi:hypothetical protein VC83_02860 [Pseudogymnoascus destructans]|uniref:25S rRNA (Uridine(2843)-N(3))-methyltransferase n=2 Tax=Pseudogymnoascus destructans TaxID=655981 RepID=L8FWW0_PSED2|nr:uncharacterized protein VC83_02860 [Pseudogymnoascus destructans]ELR04973.1 hypothetical protein GMDG_00230 [Pseudogymnoascus destructans 20631-21]OAF60315.1 hypothetical protein VC83_02860 [Pseudogymnoascus destructans]